MSDFSPIVVVLLGSFFLASNAQNPCLGVPDGTFVNDFTACDAFFTCVRDMPVPGTCPDGFIFNEPEQKCDHPWNLVCLICEEDTTGAGFVRVPIEDECRLYTLCINSRGFLQECGEGQMFNPEGRQCELEANVACEERKCPNNINPNVPTFVPDRMDCSRYVICLNREPIAEEQCSGDLLFNPKTRQCDFPENVECKEIPPPSHLECPPRGLHFIPIAGTCTEFAICFDGERVGESSCADGLIFDINTSNCQIPSEETECLAPPV